MVLQLSQRINGADEASKTALADARRWERRYNALLEFLLARVPDLKKARADAATVDHPDVASSVQSHIESLERELLKTKQDLETALGYVREVYEAKQKAEAAETEDAVASVPLPAASPGEVQHPVGGEAAC